MRQYSSVLTVVMMALVSAGCPDHEPTTMQAQAVLLPEGNTCEYTAQTGGSVKALSFGLLDLTVSSHGYYAGIQIANGMVPSQEASGLDPAQGNLETNTINMSGVHVSYDIPTGLNVDLPSHFQYTPASISPGQAGVAVVNLFQPAILKQIRQDSFWTAAKPFNDPLLEECLVDASGTALTWERAPVGGQYATILVRMTFEGQLLDGTQVLSNEFAFPVQLCTGCLIVGGTLDAQVAIPLMDQLGSEGSPCGSGQDFPVSYAEAVFAGLNVPDSEISDLQSRLQACAFDLAFPQNLANVPEVPMCGNWAQTNSTAFTTQSRQVTRLSILQCRLQVSRLNAFVNVSTQETKW